MNPYFLLEIATRLEKSGNMDKSIYPEQLGENGINFLDNNIIIEVGGYLCDDDWELIERYYETLNL